MCIRDRYGNAAKEPGTFANTALMARRMVERGVRFVQIYHNNWDTHANVAGRLPDQCKDVDQPCYALIQDLKQRGMLDETLVIWGGEFGRAPTSEGKKGRDHDHYGYTVWMAGGGVKGGMSYGSTDEFGLTAVDKRVHVHDLQATILHLMGLDHEKLTYRYSGPVSYTHLTLPTKA